MGRLTHRRVLHVKIAPDRADDDLTGIEPDANLDVESLLAPEPLGVLLDGVLHPHRGEAGPCRVILVRQGRAEEGHDAVAHDLVYGALVAVDRLHHSLEDGIEDLTGLFGVAVCQQLHGALEVRKEDRDLLAFTLQRGLRREDLLGEVLGRVGVRRGGFAGRGGWPAGKGSAAFLAELGGGLVPRAAAGAASLDAGAALLAEDGIARVFVAAARAEHCAWAPP